MADKWLAWHSEPPVPPSVLGWAAPAAAGLCPPSAHITHARLVCCVCLAYVVVRVYVMLQRGWNCERVAEDLSTVAVAADLGA